MYLRGGVVETYQVIAGFSDIKVELKERGRVTKSLSELRLWFTFRDDILCVHDYADHSKFIIIGLYDSKLNSWSILLQQRKGSRVHEDP